MQNTDIGQAPLVICPSVQVQMGQSLKCGPASRPSRILGLSGRVSLRRAGPGFTLDQTEFKYNCLLMTSGKTEQRSDAIDSNQNVLLVLHCSCRHGIIVIIIIIIIIKFARLGRPSRV